MINILKDTALIFIANYYGRLIMIASGLYDHSYAQLLISYGIILALFVFITYWAQKAGNDKPLIHVCAVAGLFCLFGAVEAFLAGWEQIWLLSCLWVFSAAFVGYGLRCKWP